MSVIRILAKHNKHRALTVVLLFCMAYGFSQKQFHVLGWKTDATVNTYLLQKMHGQYEERQKEFSLALSSRKATEAYIGRIRKRFSGLIGPMPAKTPLNARITGTIAQDGYRIEKIIYESFPGHHVTANLYLPDGKGPFPATLLFCGHESEAKATESYQRTAILFAKNGFVVLVTDPISQGERFQLTSLDGKPLTRGGTTEHTLLNEGSCLLGTSTPADELWDNVRGLDFLMKRNEVDTARIGCLGNSGGGMQTIYFAAFEKRVRIFAPCSYLATRERTLEISGASDGCAQIPGEGKYHFELSDYLIAAAPKPVLILAGRYDFIDYTGTLIAYQELKKVYAALHQSQKLKLFTCPDGHGISKPKREAAVRWFRKFLCHDSARIEEGQWNTLPENTLWCTSTGQVASGFPAEVSLPQRNLRLFEKFKSSRTDFLNQDKGTIRRKVAALLALDLNDKNVAVEKRGVVRKGDLVFQKLILRKKDQIPLPVLLLDPPGGKPDKMMVCLDQDGKEQFADSVAFLQSLLRKNYGVLLGDLSGTGETTDNPRWNDPKYYNKEYRNAVLALHTGCSMTAIRTADILTLMDFFRSVPAHKNIPVEILAVGNTTIAALHAAFLDPSIGSLQLYGGIQTFKTFLEDPVQKNGYSCVINGVLKYYDLPDLVNLAGKEKIHYHK
jgi:dienelactone hydrolase